MASMIYYMGKPIHCKIKSVTIKETGDRYNLMYWRSLVTGTCQYYSIPANKDERKE